MVPLFVLNLPFWGSGMGLFVHLRYVDYGTFPACAAKSSTISWQALVVPDFRAAAGWMMMTSNQFEINIPK